MISVYNLVILTILDACFRLFAQVFASNAQLRCIQRHEKHAFTWFWRQNPTEKNYTIPWYKLIQFFPCYKVSSLGQVLLQGHTLDLHTLYTANEVGHVTGV